MRTSPDATWTASMIAALALCALLAACSGGGDGLCAGGACCTQGQDSRCPAGLGDANASAICNQPCTVPGLVCAYYANASPPSCGGLTCGGPFESDGGVTRAADGGTNWFCLAP